jgi:polyhydroxybutyrate depolymerase
MKQNAVMIAFSVAIAACGGSTKKDGDAAVSLSDSAVAFDAATDAASMMPDTDAGGTLPNDMSMSSMSAGCGTTPAHTAAYTGTTTDGKGTSRSYSVLLPAAYDKDKPLAITFGYHGAGGTSSAAQAFGIQNGSGAAAASIFVFPQGIDFESDGVGWDDTCAGYDMVLFDNILAAMEKSYCIDTARVFVAGFSWGCDQVTALTCCRGDKIRAMSGASCTDEYSDNTNYKTYANLACPHLDKTGIRFTHDASGGDSAYPKPEFATTSSLYQSWAACPTFTGTLTADQCHTYAGCASSFIECPYTGLGHATPANWGPDTWAFFASY